MPFIGLQAGHQNIQNNIDPLLRSGTGAPGEMEFNVKVRDTLSSILQKYGFQVQLDDANANSSPDTIGKDFDFYLAIHAEGAPVGGNVVAPDPSVDASNTQSKRIVQAINDVYFSDTGIENDGIVTVNETFYYMWNVLTAKTPCGIIECGDLLDPHDSVILTDIRRVSLGIAHGLCIAFNISWRGDPDITPPAPSNPCADVEQKYTELMLIYKKLQTDFDQYRLDHPYLLTINTPITTPMASTSTTYIAPLEPKKRNRFLEFIQSLLE